MLHVSAHEGVQPPGSWDAACSCGALMRDSLRRSALAALHAHIDRHEEAS